MWDHLLYHKCMKFITIDYIWRVQWVWIWRPFYGVLFSFQCHLLNVPHQVVFHSNLLPYTLYLSLPFVPSLPVFAFVVTFSCILSLLSSNKQKARPVISGIGRPWHFYYSFRDTFNFIVPTSIVKKAETHSDISSWHSTRCQDLVITSPFLRWRKILIFLKEFKI